MIVRVPRTARLEAVVWACAIAAGALACLPGVWWEPLHLDERVMLEFARGSPWSIVDNVFIERGGAPAQFLVERITLAWPGGLAGLRLPSLLFFLAALPCAGLLARRLAGRAEGLAVPPLLALAPLAVGLATFARMYALFLLLVLVTSLIAIRAGRDRSRNWWIAAGAFAAGLVYVHPIAPLYIVPALACGLAVSDVPLRQTLLDARPGLVAGAVVGLPYLYALAVLRSRYGVGEAGPISTTAGRTVAEEAFRSLSPAGVLGLLAFAGLAVAGSVQLGRERPRAAVVLAGWVLLPVAFFTIVPAETRFFGRYLLPALPAFLILVTAGCRLLGRRRPVVVALVVAAVALEVGADVDRVRGLYDLDLRALPRTASDQVLFSSTGTPASRPPELLDDLIALRTGRLNRLEELPAIDPRYEHGLLQKGVRNVHDFLERTGGGLHGVWVFRGRPRRVRAAERRVSRGAAGRDVSTSVVGDQFLVVTSRRSLDPRQLVELGVSVREAWGTGTPADRWPRLLVAIDEQALG